MDAAHRGEVALSSGNPQQALELFTTALKQSPASPNYWIKRSIAYHRLKLYPAALTDIEYAIVAASKRGKRELIGEAQLRRGITLLALDRISDARLSFAWAGKYGANKNQCSIWTAKVKQKVNDLEEGDERLKISNIQAIPDISLPSPEEISVASSNASPAAPAASAPAKAAPPPVPSSSQTIDTVAATPPATATGSSTLAKNIRHEWYQNSDNVYLNLFAKNVPKDHAVVEIQPNFVNISFPLDSGSTFDFSVDPVFSQVKHSAASFRILPTKVEVTLPKAIPGIKWDNLEGDVNAAAPISGQSQSLQQPAQPAAVASPYATKGGQAKDWDKITQSLSKPKDTKGKGKENSNEPDTQVEDEEVKIGEEDDIEGDPADHFFKQLFKNADPDTRRAMMKSYQESGGTALSTNWSEVSKAPVPISPPDGMEAKKWQS